MHKNLQNNTKILIVSDTGMFQKEGKVYAFGPVVKEVDVFSELTDGITWIGFNKPDQKTNTSYLNVTNSKVKIIRLDKVGGKTRLDKFKIILAYPKMLKIVNSQVKECDIIHSRAPSNPAVIVMLLSLFYKKKMFWFKYAGSWVDKVSFFYDVQRKFLKRLNSNSIITVNGNWQSENKNILPFENPCIDEIDRKQGFKICKQKKFSKKLKYCFVGGLTKEKGVDILIDLLKDINQNLIGEFHFVGDGILKQELIEVSKISNIDIKIHGTLSKQEVFNVFAECQFIVLPSQSEGFPKVVSEAMNFGCIPIVSNMSCIDQYITANKNGFLIEKPYKLNLVQVFRSIQLLNSAKFEEMISFNYEKASIFTYNKFKEKIESEILR